MHIQISSDGYSYLPSYRPELSSYDAFLSLGAIDELQGFSNVQILRPKQKYAAEPNTYSGNFGVDAFPMHTDLAHWMLPPRYVALRAVFGSADVVTRLFDGKRLIEALGSERLARALVQPRRPVNGNKQLLRLLQSQREDGSSIVRWDSIYLQPATSNSETIYADIRAYLEKIAPIEITLLNPGDTLVIDNWRMLHGRSDCPDSAERRIIERAYLRKLL
jgi:L-asparagine oxygenase